MDKLNCSGAGGKKGKGPFDDDSNGSNGDETTRNIYRTPKRKINQSSDRMEGFMNIFDSPTKYEAIESDTSPGIPPSISIRTPSRRQSLRTSYMLKRFLDDSPQRQSDKIVMDSPVHSQSHVPSISPIKSPGRNPLYIPPSQKSEVDTIVIPESPQVSEDGTGSLASWFKGLEDVKVPEEKSVRKIDFDCLRFRRELCSEEFVDISPFHSPSQTRTHPSNSQALSEPEEEVEDTKQNTTAFPSFLSRLNLTPQRRGRRVDSEVDPMEITVDNSPSKSEIERNEGNIRNSSQSKGRMKLVPQMKRVIAQHEFSVRSWRHKIKRNALTDLDDSSALHLFLARDFKLKGHHDKGQSAILTLCLNLPRSNGIIQTPDINQGDLCWKWVLFKIKNPEQFIPGSTLIKLYPPWGEMFIGEMKEQLIFRTDFHKLIQPNEVDVDYLATQTRVQVARGEIDKKFSSFLKSCNSSSALLSLVPYKIGNKKTIQKQMDFYNRRSIELDVVICHVWFYDTYVGFVVKDSEEILSYVETKPSDASLLQNLSPGKYFKFQGIMSRQYVTPDLWRPLFSVIGVFGLKQTLPDFKFYHRLHITKETKWEVVPELQIPFTIPDFTPKRVEELFHIPENSDCRKVVKGYYELPPDLDPDDPEFYFYDDKDGEGMRLRVIVLPCFPISQLFSIPTRVGVQLFFLRLYRGIATLDQFSSVQRL